METNEPSSVERSRLLGASPGIGEATAQRLATAGYKVYGTSSEAPARVWSRVCVQAVLPAATRTEIWGHAGVDVDTLPAVMEVDDLVDAALAGFDRREAVTIPPLHDVGRWDAFEAARQTMISGFWQSQPADRYRVDV